MSRFVSLIILLMVFTATAAHALRIEWRGVRPLTPVQVNGQLSVSGPKIVNDKGQVTVLSGPSLFWSNSGWGQDGFYNADAVRTFARDWNSSVIRASIGIDGDGSFTQDPVANMARAETVIQAAIANGIYVIVDYHTHEAERNVEQAQRFFLYLSQKYGHHPNVIWEIYNEPLVTTDWNSVIKPFAETIIRTIRAGDPDNLIIVGTQSYSQDLERVIANPITGQRNLLYALHFYAAGHKDDLRNRVEAALRTGIPVFVSEWGTVNYDGDGAVDTASSEAWIALMKRHQLSHTMWAVSDKREGASMFRPGVSRTGPWTDTDLTSSGRYARDIIRNW